MKKLFTSIIAIFALFLSVYFGFVETHVEPNNDEPKVYFIDVGQGDSSLVLADDTAILIDGGGNSSEKTIVEFLKDKGVTKLDLVVATHAHEDHIGGLDAVIDNVSVDNLLISSTPYNSKTYEDVLTSANNKKVNILDPVDYDTLSFGNINIDLLTPPSDFESNNTNNDSIVFVLSYGDADILYTGDMETELENALLTQFYDIDILKVAHHGSKTSSTKQVIDIIKPEISVISVGKDNKYSHPHKETLDNLQNSEIYRTDLISTISFELKEIS